MILNVAGVDEGIPVDLEGGTVTNMSFNPSDFRMLYGGTGLLKLTSGAAQTASVYAPLAEARITGGADFFGAIVASKIIVSGGANVHYDRRLQDVFSVGSQTMREFMWKEC